MVPASRLWRPLSTQILSQTRRWIETSSYIVQWYLSVCRSYFLDLTRSNIINKCGKSLLPEASSSPLNLPVLPRKRLALALHTSSQSHLSRFSLCSHHIPSIQTNILNTIWANKTKARPPFLAAQELAPALRTPRRRRSLRGSWER